MRAVYLLLHLAMNFQRVRDVGKHLKSSPFTAQDNGAEVKRAPGESLVNRNALDVSQHDLD